MKKTIGILGRPIAGKTTTLQELSKRYNLNVVNDIFLDEERNRHLKNIQFAVENIDVEIYTLPGPVFYMDELYKFILSRADIVFYFHNLEMDYKYDNDVELDYFHHHYYIANKLNKLWTDIPWQFVLNKRRYVQFTDFKEIQFDTIVPIDLQQQALRTDTYRGIGIELIWQRILELIHI